MYTVLATTDLVFGDETTEVGSYLAVAPGTITIPAVDAAPYLTADTGFFDVAMPVTEVVELED